MGVTGWSRGFVPNETPPNCLLCWQERCHGEKVNVAKSFVVKCRKTVETVHTEILCCQIVRITQRGFCFLLLYSIKLKSLDRDHFAQHHCATQRGILTKPGL